VKFCANICGPLDEAGMAIL